MPLRIALVSPKGPLYRHRGGIFGRALRYCPLTLSTLAALVPRELGADVTIYDEGVMDIPDDLEADLVGITAITGTANRAYELSARLRARGIPVVLGGPHVTLIPDDAQPHADAIVAGYAEQTWPELLRDFTAGRMRARYVQGPDLSLAGMPFPRRDLMPRGRYLITEVFESSRGCVYDCEFCVVPAAWGRTPYLKPVDEVVEDIRRTGARRALFIDLNLTADRDHATRLFEALIPLRIEWYGLATGHLATNPELLSLCERSGCRGLLVGFESLSAEANTSIRKGFNSPNRYKEMMQTFHRHHIAIQGCFVFGLDSDTPDVFLKTAQFVVEAGVDLPRFAIATPFPGTAFHKRLEREGRILTRNWELYDAQHVVFQPAHMSPQQLQRGAEQAWRYSYSFRSIGRRLASTGAPLPVGIVTNLGYRHYAHNLHRFYHCDWPLGRAPAVVPEPAAAASGPSAHCG